MTSSPADMQRKRWLQLSLLQDVLSSSRGDQGRWDVGHKRSVCEQEWMCGNECSCERLKKKNVKKDWTLTSGQRKKSSVKQRRCEVEVESASVCHCHDTRREQQACATLKDFSLCGKFLAGLPLYLQRVSMCFCVCWQGFCVGRALIDPLALAAADLHSQPCSHTQPTDI